MAKPAGPKPAPLRPHWAAILLLGIGLLALGLLATSIRFPVEVVRVDYLYADWCEHCPAYSPQVQQAVGEFGGQVKLTVRDEAMRKSDGSAAAMYADYKARGLFYGFPTLVAHGAGGDVSLQGLREKGEVTQWLCQQFKNPPRPCKSS